MSRLDKWKKAERLVAFITGENKTLSDAIGDIQKNKEKDEEAPSMSDIDIIRASKELIFNIKDGKPVFHLIMYTFNVEKCELELSHLLNLEIDDEDPENDIIHTLAFNAAVEIPVYPNDDSLSTNFARYHRKMLIDGFIVKNKNKGKTRYILTKSPGKNIDSPKYIQELSSTHYYSPLEISLIKNSVFKELKRLENAERTLLSLKKAIKDLEIMLDSEFRNENELQRHLTENPVLFGLEYSRIIPKHKLGSEYEMDYALKRYSGLYDLVEIESSSLKLYTKAGNPSSQLVHAEQQVFDWLDWIEKHSPYAREKLPGLISPHAYVVIGRRSNLTEKDLEKLKRRNAVYDGKIQVLTYNDLLERADNIFKQLEFIKT